MSKYTTEVRFICEHYAGYDSSQGLDRVDDVIRKSRNKIFDFDYPIFDGNYKSVLETKILKHFYTREIGAETVGLWKLWLNTRMNEIMPYYNKLYESELLEFNPLYDTDLTKDYIKEGEGSKEDNETRSRETKDTTEQTGKTSGTTSDDDWNYYSDTPQGGVDGLADMNYLTNATHVINEGESSNGFESTIEANGSVDDTNKLKGEYEDTVKYLEHVKGKQAGVSFAKMLMEYRDTFINIDLMIIRELNDLFMNLW